LDPERWQELRRLFESALEKDTAVRSAFLDEACSSDPDLRKEVQVLLDNYCANSFLEKPAYAAVPELFQSEGGEAIIGQRLGAYEISRKLGQGGMGIVYLARDCRLDRPVAIKMLAPKYTNDSQFRERLRREARAVARLSHPGIATVYSLEEFEESFYIVSEYVQGHTLLKLIEKGSVPVSQLIDIAVQITKALAAAHAQGIVHRDLKPENIILTESGMIKILDFGLARFEPGKETGPESRITRSGVFLGTPAYASPEQLLGTEVDRRTDIFSLGVLLYELAAGKHPFGISDSMSTVARILEADVPDLIQLNPKIPRRLDSIIHKCLKKRPRERYEDALELLAQLITLSEGRKVKPVTGSSSALWWWQFHQAVAGFGYYGMLYPIWYVKHQVPSIEGSLYFFPAVIAVGIAANLRLHLWFTSAFYRSELPEQRRKVFRWIRWADWVFVLELAASAVRMHERHAIYATILMAVAILALVGFMLIEPTTAKAAFDNDRNP
jgi:eukaryotic-like serine/threonine-protein kinase